MSKIFALIQEKRNKIKNLYDSINEIISLIKDNNTENWKTSMKLKEEHYELEMIEKKEDEITKKNKIMLITIILIIISIISMVHFCIQGFNLMSVLLIGLSSDFAVVIICKSISNILTRKYEFSRIMNYKEIEARKSNISHLKVHEKALEVEKENLYKKVEQLKLEIKNEESSYKDLMSKIIDKHAVLLDRLIIDSLNNDPDEDLVMEINILRELVSKNI